MSWKADGRTLVSAGADNTIKVWDADTGERKKNVTGFDKEVTAVAFVADTDQFLAASGEGKVKLVKEGGSDVRSFSGAGSDFVYAGTVTLDGKLVVAGGQDGVPACGTPRTGKRSGRSSRRRRWGLGPPPAEPAFGAASVSGISRIEHSPRSAVSRLCSPSPFSAASHLR